MKNIIFLIAFILDCLQVYSQWCGTESDEHAKQFRIKTAEQRAALALQRRSDKSRASVNYFAVQHHVIRRSDGTGGISFTDINNAMQQVNDLYIDANIQFYQCGEINYIDSDNYYDIDQSASNPEDLNALVDAENVEHRINIYYVHSYINSVGNDLCGVKTGSAGNPRLRIFMVNHCIDGWTIRHELGHFFGLDHTHGDWNCPPDSDPGKITDEFEDGSNCGSAGDQICDTEADPNMGCGRNWVNSSCNYTGNVVDGHGDSFHPLTDNIMSYTRDECRSSFTSHQLANMELYAINDLAADYLCWPCAGSDMTMTVDAPSGITREYRSLNNIYARNTINTDANITYRARNKIILEPSFKAKPGCIFRADIACVFDESPSKIQTITATTDGAEPANERISRVDVYPNPSHSDITVSYSLLQDDIISLCIYNLQGQKIHTYQNAIKEPVGTYNKKFQLSDLPSGTYVIVIQGNNQILRKSILKTE